MTSERIDIAAWVTPGEALKILTAASDSRRAVAVLYLGLNERPGMARASTTAVELDIGPLGMVAPIETSSTILFIGRPKNRLGNVLGAAFWAHMPFSEFSSCCISGGTFASSIGSAGFSIQLPGKKGHFTPARHRSTAYDVRLKRTDVEELAATAARLEPVATKKAGRRPALTAWDWSAVEEPIRTIIRESRFEECFGKISRGTLARLEKYIGACFSSMCGDEPSTSQIRRHANELLDMAKAKSTE